MFRLSTYVKKEIKQQQLNEAFDSLGAVSDEIKSIILSKYGKKAFLGKKSYVKILPYEPEKMYDDLTKDGQILYVVLRYGQGDLAIFDEHWDGINSRTLSDLYTFYDNDFPFSKIKSASGFKKNCNDIVKFIVQKFGLKRKDVLAKFNFQVIYADTEMIDIQKARKERKNKQELTVNNAISNYGMNVDIKKRLKNYIENKIPNITDINNLPKDLKLFKDKFKFKIFNAVYEFDDIIGDSSSLLFPDPNSKNQTFIRCSCKNWYEISNKSLVRIPKCIFMQIESKKLSVDSFKISITNIVAGDIYDFRYGSTSPIDEWFKKDS